MILNEYWDDYLLEHPLFATFAGDNRNNNKCTHFSQRDFQRRLDKYLAFKEKLQKIPYF